MCLKQLTFTKTTAMSFKLKNLFFVIALAISTGVVYGAHDNDGQEKGKPVATENEKQGNEALKSELNTKGGAPTINARAGGVSASSKDAIFFSNGDMYVAGQDGAGKEHEASMLIVGSAEFGNEAQIYQKGITSLTGDFLSSKSSEALSKPESGELKQLFVDSDNSKGTIRFVGENNKQEIKRVGYRFKDAGVIKFSGVSSDEKLKSPLYVLNFPRIEVRKEEVNTMADVDSYIAKYPGYDVKKVGYVSVATNAAVKVGELDIVNGNRFSVDAKTAARELEQSSGNKPNAIDAANWYRLHIGYADIRKMTGEDNLLPGHSEVDLDLYDYDDAKNGFIADGGLADVSDKFLNSNSYNVAKVNGRDVYATYLRGFSSPFESLRADYMFYHVLTKPVHGSITDHTSNGPLGDPKTQFEKGRGYFYAMDVSSDYYQNIDKNWNHGGTGWLNRTRGGYHFSRLVHEYQNKNNGLNLYSIDKNKSNYEAQRFNAGDITVKLVTVGNTPHTNILGNPYMTPIYIGDILAEKVTQNLGEDNMAPDGLYYKYDKNNPSDVPFVTGFAGNPEGQSTKVKAVTILDKAARDNAIAGNYALIKSAYWTVNTGFVMRSTKNGFPTYSYNVKYDFVDFIAPATVDKQNKRIIEPMQMFLLQVAAPGEFVFNPKMKVLPEDPKRFTVKLKDNLSEGLPDPRAVKSEGEDDSFATPDWLIVETSVTGNSVTTDRTALRFYDKATLGYDEALDIQKQLVATPKVDANARMKSEAADDVDLFEPMNVVYTKSSDGRELLGNAIGYTTKEVPLYYIPSNNRQEEVTMTIHGMDRMEGVEGAWLIERDGSGKEIYKQDLFQDNSYTFVSAPVENPLKAENRFILRFFDDGDDNGPSLVDKPITCYYSGSTLYIGGLNEKDLGSIVQIFDLQGRLMGNTVINNHPSMEYQKALGQGTFVVRISGKRNYTTKFVNIQNY